MFVIYFFLFIFPLTSGLLFLVFKKTNPKHLKLTLAFSGAYLFAITVLHLIPDIYASKYNFIGIYILIGFFFQILLEFLSEGIEHGHIHIHKHSAAFPLAVIISLCVHSFLEGMPLANPKSLGTSTANSLLMGIILHHIPVAFALMSMLGGSGIKKQNSILLLALFAAMAPLGTLTSNFLGSNMTENLALYFDKIMAIVIGIFLHISTTILFESSEEHRFNLYKFITILIGAGIALITI